MAPRPTPPAGRGRRALTASALTGALLLAGCGADGPTDPEDGDYRFLAASTPEVPYATVTVADGGLVLSTDGGDTRSAIGEPAEESELCPGGGTGSPLRLEGPIDLGTLRLASPAVYGDCGDTTPVRITVVDLDSAGDGRPPYTRWVEFCLGSDPDCPS